MQKTDNMIAKKKNYTINIRPEVAKTGVRRVIVAPVREDLTLLGLAIRKWVMR